ncbi:MAG: site-specific integrase [Thermoplasmatales archaeon]|nr:site-specific integrase [Thermoplasmatales archaeon]
MVKIEEFLLTLNGAQSAYKSTLNKFFRVIEDNPDKYFIKSKSLNDYENDVWKFFQALKGKPPKSIRHNISVIRSFLEWNEIEPKKKLWKTINNRIHGTRAVTIDAVPTNRELKEILQHGTTKDRALFLCSSSSGMRIEELLKLKISDVDFESTPTCIKVRAETTKTGNWRYAFISNEATETLKAWFKERDSYLKTIVNRNYFRHYNKTIEDDTVFPFEYDVARISWLRLIKKAGYDERDPTTNRYKMHIHSLRKYFRTRMSLEIPVDLVEAIMGHEGYLTEVYRRYDERQLGEMYKKGEHTVTVFETAIDTKDLEERIEEKDEEIYYLKKEMKTIKSEMGNFQKIIDDPHFRMEMMNMMANHWDMLQNKQNQK